MQFNETRQTHPQVILNIVILPLVPCVIGSKSTVVRAAVPYPGQRYHDIAHHDGAQSIAGCVVCTYYDFGDEGGAYRDSDATHKVSGSLSPADRSYLNEFRWYECVDTSDTKYHNALDDNSIEIVNPPQYLLYVGSTDPGEWFNITVNGREPGRHNLSPLYTSKNGGAIAPDLNGNSVNELIRLGSTYSASDSNNWRQWHDWNYAKDVASVELPGVVDMITLRPRGQHESRIP